MTNAPGTAPESSDGPSAGSTVGAGISAAGGVVILASSFMPWVQFGVFFETDSANAWTGFGGPLGYEGVSIAAVLLGVGAAAATTFGVLVNPDTAPGSSTRRLTLGIVTLIAGVGVIVLGALRVLLLDNLFPAFSADDLGPFAFDWGMYVAYLGACCLIAGGIVEIVKSRVKRPRQTWQPPTPRLQPPTLPRPAPQAAQPAAWHPDPMGRYEYRYWDGTQWTANVATGGQNFQDPL